MRGSDTRGSTVYGNSYTGEWRLRAVNLNVCRESALIYVVQLRDGRNFTQLASIIRRLVL